MTTHPNHSSLRFFFTLLLLSTSGWSVPCNASPTFLSPGSSTVSHCGRSRTRSTHCIGHVESSSCSNTDILYAPRGAAATPGSGFFPTHRKAQLDQVGCHSNEFRLRHTGSERSPQTNPTTSRPVCLAPGCGRSCLSAYARESTRSMEVGHAPFGESKGGYAGVRSGRASSGSEGESKTRCTTAASSQMVEPTAARVLIRELWPASGCGLRACHRCFSDAA